MNCYSPPVLNFPYVAKVALYAAVTGAAATLLYKRVERKPESTKEGGLETVLDEKPEEFRDDPSLFCAPHA